MRHKSSLRLFLRVAKHWEEERTTLTSHYRACGPGRQGSLFHSQDVSAAVEVRARHCPSAGAALRQEGRSGRQLQLQRFCAKLEKKIRFNVLVLQFPAELDKENVDMVQLTQACDTRCVKKLA